MRHGWRGVDVALLVAFAAVTVLAVAAALQTDRINVRYDQARFSGALYEEKVEPCFRLPGAFDGISAESYPPLDSVTVRGLPARRDRVRACFAQMPGATVRVE